MIVFSHALSSRLSSPFGAGKAFRQARLTALSYDSVLYSSPGNRPGLATLLLPGQLPHDIGVLLFEKARSRLSCSDSRGEKHGRSSSLERYGKRIS